MQCADKTIIVVDDEPDVRQYLATIHEDAGFKVKRAADGEEALRMIREERPDFISLDLIMPRKSGHKLLYELRKDKYLSRIPVLIVTAANGREGKEQLQAQKPDLNSLDITMPEQPGIPFYRDLKENPGTADIPVVVVTAVTGYGGDPEPFERFLSTRKQVPPPEAFLIKPIDREEFIRVIRELV